MHAAFAVLSAALYDYPSDRVKLLGVTGTNGKTTTTHLIEHILSHGGIKAGLIGTLGARFQGSGGEGEQHGPYQASQYIDLKHTTPQASDLQALLGTMAGRGVTHAAMEVSSHALALKRVYGCHFASGCLTNISQDHLDFHKTMENYWQSKRILFEMLAQTAGSRSAVINLDDDLAPRFIQAIPQRSQGN